MAFAERFRFNFTNHVSENLVECTIYEDGFTDVVSYIKGTAIPIVRNYKLDDQDIFAPILPSYLELNLIEESDGQFDDFFNKDYKIFKVVLEENSTITGRYWIKTDNFTKRHGYPLNEVKVIAVDGLATLRNEPFWDNGDLYEGRRSVAEVLRICLNNIGILDEVHMSVNLFEDNHTSTAGSTPLTQTYIDSEVFWLEEEPDNMYDVIDALLRPFGARIFQAQNVWKIIRINEMNTTFNYVVYSLALGSTTSNSTLNPVLTLTGNAVARSSRIDWINNSTSLSNNRAYEDIEIKFERQYRSSLWSRDEFREDWWHNNNTEVLGIGVSGTTIRQDSETVYEKNDLAFYPIEMLGNTGFMFKLREDLDGVAPLVFYIEVEVEYRYKGDYTSNTEHTNNILIVNGSHGIDSDGAWIPIASYGGIDMPLKKTSLEYSSYKVMFAASNADNNLSVTINPPLAINVVVKAISANWYEREVVNGEERFNRLENKETISYNTGQNTNRKYTTDLRLGDLTINDTSSAITVIEDVYKGSFWSGFKYLDSGEYKITQIWNSEGTLQHVLRGALANQYGVNQRTLEGTIKGFGITPITTIEEPTDDDRLYIINNLSEDLKRQEYKVELVNLNIYEDVFIIDELGQNINDEAGEGILGVVKQ